MEQEKLHPEVSSSDYANDDDHPVVLITSKENHSSSSSSSTETTSTLEDSSSSSSSDLTCNTSLSPTTITLSSPASFDGDHHTETLSSEIPNQEDESSAASEEEERNDDRGEDDDNILSQLLLPPPKIVVEEYKQRNHVVIEQHHCVNIRSLGVEIHNLKNFRRDKTKALEALDNLILWMPSVFSMKMMNDENFKYENQPQQQQLQQHFILLAIPHVVDLIEDNMNDMDRVEKGLDVLYRGVASTAVVDEKNQNLDMHKSLFVSSVSLASRNESGGSIGWLLKVMKQRQQRFNVSDNNFQCWMILGRIAEAQDACIIDDEELIRENLTEMFLSRLSLRYWDSIQCWSMRQLMLREDLPLLRKQFFGEEGVIKYVRDEQGGAKSYIPIFIFIRSLLNDPNFLTTSICDNDDLDKASLVDWIVYATIEIMRYKDESANCQHEGMEILEALLQMAGSGDRTSPPCMLVQVRSAMIKAKAIRVLGNIFDSYKEDEIFKLNERAHKLIKPLL